MPNFKSYFVAPALPEKLEPLKEIAYNMWWTWNPVAIGLFMRLDPDIWEETNHNPVMLLHKIPQEKLEQAVADDAFMSSLDTVHQAFQRYLEGAVTWYKGLPARPDGEILVAYFSAEYGLTECLPLYSGGLGILAGDHVKSSSETGIPFVGVGILYQKGYFRQYLNPDGWQQEYYPINDYGFLPIRLVKDATGEPLVVPVPFHDRTVWVQVWRVDVGRNAVFLLDSNIDRNQRQDQDVTDYLYGGDVEMRICQEYLLGIGGIRALHAMGYRPTVCHLNEGHAAFVGVERVRALMEEEGLTFREAREVVAASGVFTTHTPVPAGMDYFPPALVEKYFSHYIRQLGIGKEEFLALGKIHPTDPNEYFCMSVLALRLSYHANGVSRLHGEVSRKMWKGVWPQLLPGEVPIGHVTNGICQKSWLSPGFREMYDRYLGPRWVDHPTDTSVWKRAELIPNEELWRTHEVRRERLVAFVRRRLQNQLTRNNASREEIDAVAEVLDPKALTIGFARRFASYKRAALVFTDRTRLARLLSDPQRPVQIIFGGKAHPKDELGKEIIRSIVHICREEPFNRRVVFVEDYDINVSRYMVQGCDVWLNNPRRPMEASGTSGMKALVNGVLNFSVIDGWWAEAYEPGVGWNIGQGETYENNDYADRIESRFLYDVLEKEIIPLFYTRGRDQVPRGWAEKMKTALKLKCPVFTTNRMVREYAETFYLPAGERTRGLLADGHARARELAAWKEKMVGAWERIAVTGTESNISANGCKVGGTLWFKVRLRVPAGIEVGDLRVEVVHGLMGVEGELAAVRAEELRCARREDDGDSLFEGAITCQESGSHGYAVRVVPHHPLVRRLSEFPLVKWAS